MSTLWRNTMKTLFIAVKYQRFVFDVEYTYIPMIPGKSSGPQEDCYPDEPEEVTLISVALVGYQSNLMDIISESVLTEIEEIICARHQPGELE